MLSLSLLAGFILLGGLLVNASSAFREAGVGTSTHVNVGFIELAHLSKSVAASGGEVVQIEFRAGLFWYIAFWVLVGCGLGYLRWRMKRGKAPTPSA